MKINGFKTKKNLSMLQDILIYSKITMYIKRGE